LFEKEIKGRLEKSNEILQSELEAAVRRIDPQLKEVGKKVNQHDDFIAELLDKMETLENKIA
jgi:peptidoglycan hydrolase CwlO-like protein